MKPLITLILSFFFFSGFSQSNEVEHLKDITNMPYICRLEIGNEGCGQDEFWNVVKYKLDAISYLIEKLDDTTKTSALVPNFGGYWTVGDIAFRAIEEIIDGIPTFKLLATEFDSQGCGYCSYWNHLRSNDENRRLFKEALKKWYAKSKNDLIWVTDKKTLTCDCSFTHPNKGHFEIKNKTGGNTK